MFVYNPWYGCKKISIGCNNCFIFNKNYNGFKISNTFDILIRKRNNKYIIRPGEVIDVCIYSDFFLEEAKEERKKIYEYMKIRSDLTFYLYTKRTNIIKDDFDFTLKNVIFVISAENQDTFNKRVKDLLDINYKFIIELRPLLGMINIFDILNDNKNIIEIRAFGLENSSSKPLLYDDVLKISIDTKQLNIPFYFISTGDYFIKENKFYKISKDKQRIQAYLSNLSHN